MSTSEYILSEDQQQALDRIEEWNGLGAAGTELSLGGLAGTGKTTLVSLLLNRTHPSLAPTVLAPTAKACSVLRRKGVTAATIHSAVLKFEGVDASGPRPLLDFSEKHTSLRNLVIVDEASMVTGYVADVLRRAVCERGGKILWVGDHGQLPPVGDDPRILAQPDIRLEKIHRQAEASPILQVALAVRGGRRLVDAAAEHAIPGHVRAVACPTMLHLEELMATEKPDVVLVARNDTRRSVNRLGWKLVNGGEEDDFKFPDPYQGAPLIALRNSHKFGIVNGEQYELENWEKYPRSPEFMEEVVLKDYLGGRTECTAWTPALGEGIDRKLKEASEIPYDVVLLDFAFAITVHRAQGSEWPHVLVIDETVTGKAGWDAARWGYTAATRAKERLTVVRMGR